MHCNGRIVTKVYKMMRLQAAILRLHRPMTTITDFITGMVGLILCILLGTQAVAQMDFGVIIYSGSILLFAIAHILGAIFHGFKPRFTDIFNRRLWLSTLIIASGSSFLAKVTIIIVRFSAPALYIAIVIMTLLFLAMLIYVLNQKVFKVVVIYQLVGFFFILLVEIYSYWQTSTESSLWIMGGVIILINHRQS
jgi:hypothetical protein